MIILMSIDEGMIDLILIILEKDSRWLHFYPLNYFFKLGDKLSIKDTVYHTYFLKFVGHKRIIFFIIDEATFLNLMRLIIILI